MAGVFSGEVVGEGRAFGGVTAIEQQSVGCVGSRLLHERCDLGQAEVGGLIFVVIPRKDVAVRIGGIEQGDGFGLRGLLFLRCSRREASELHGRPYER